MNKRSKIKSEKNNNNLIQKWLKSKNYLLVMDSSGNRLDLGESKVKVRSSYKIILDPSLSY